MFLFEPCFYKNHAFKKPWFYRDYSVAGNKVLPPPKGFTTTKSCAGFCFPWICIDELKAATYYIDFFKTREQP
jgi:hypothetical protein